ncbi:hypothetical protein E2C01_034025 [Portunus trituberculatus]|uniref:Uncharacterized protein n=1 Tax=Portunus trituberculatus TaxID=210409 RepID=A0A5B7F5P6_PORTR|nr:hypothetical protein [Portunus trituberculatus]
MGPGYHSRSSILPCSTQRHKFTNQGRKIPSPSDPGQVFGGLCEEVSSVSTRYADHRSQHSRRHQPRHSCRGHEKEKLDGCYTCKFVFSSVFIMAEFDT